YPTRDKKFNTPLARQRSFGAIYCAAPHTEANSPHGLHLHCLLLLFHRSSLTESPPTLSFHLHMGKGQTPEKVNGQYRNGADYTPPHHPGRRPALQASGENGRPHIPPVAADAG